MDRRSALRAALGALVGFVVPRVVRADEDVAVPVPLQMELLVKVAAYDRNLPTRAAGVVRLVILVKKDDPQSKHVAELALRALEGKNVLNLPTEVTQYAWVDGPGLATRIRDGRVSMLYAAPGFGARELLSIARALSGLSVLSSGALAHFVETGVAICFDLVGGKPKLLVNLRRAREQGVDLSSQVLKLAKVVE